MRRCGCWKFPIALFLVNRTMHQLATEVFYSRNHFEIKPVLCRRNCYYHEDACFLQPHLQANDLRKLRQIMIHIPPDLVDYPKDDQLRVLRQVTGRLRGKVTLQRLL